MENEDKKALAIGGWLILIAIGIVFTPIKVLILMMTTYSEIFLSEAWGSLTTQGSDAYNPLWAPIIIGEMLFNGVIFFAYLYMAYLFFCKKSAFPKWYISVAVLSLIFIVADAFSLKLVIPDEPAFDSDTLKEFLRSLFIVVVWVPYMLISTRVKATFINE